MLAAGTLRLNRHWEYWEDNFKNEIKFSEPN